MSVRKDGGPTIRRKNEEQREMSEGLRQAYEQAPVLRVEFRTSAPTGGRRLLPLVPKTSLELDLVPSDWDNEAYRRHYTERLIVLPDMFREPTVYTVRTDGREPALLLAFIKQYRGKGLELIEDYDNSRGTVVLFLTPELKDKLSQMRFKVEPYVSDSS